MSISIISSSGFYIKRPQLSKINPITPVSLYSNSNSNSRRKYKNNSDIISYEDIKVRDSIIDTQEFNKAYEVILSRSI